MGACQSLHIASLCSTDTSSTIGSSGSCCPNGGAASQPGLPAELSLVLSPTETWEPVGHSVTMLEQHGQVRDMLPAKSKEAHSALCFFLGAKGDRYRNLSFMLEGMS